MNWKIADISAGFYCYDDGRIYPTSSISIKLEGDITCEATFYYGYQDTIGSKVGITVYPDVKDYKLFPDPIYTHPDYSPLFLKQSGFRFDFEVKNSSEIAEKYYLAFGSYKGNVKVKSLSFNYFQPEGRNYCEGEIESIDVSNEISGHEELEFRANKNTPIFKCNISYKDNQALQLDITDTSTSKLIQSILLPENEMFAKTAAYFKDITFTGDLSILIPLERSASYVRFLAFVWNPET